MFQSSPAPKGRCNDARRSTESGLSGFNPHRPRRADATYSPTLTARLLWGFNPHRPRRADATIAPPDAVRSRGCFNPHRPRRADATWPGTGAISVSIVSILTGPEGPMQRPALQSRAPAPPFQSSPAPKGRCNKSCTIPGCSIQLFQSSPAPKGRCNTILVECIDTSLVSILTGPEGPMQQAQAGEGLCA